MQVYLIRHGTPERLSEEHFRGQTDLPLSETGLKQASAVKDYFNNKQISAIYSSPLLRAIQTVEQLSLSKGLNIQIADSINDVDFGSWTGLTNTEVMIKDPGEFEIWRKRPLEMVFDNGSSIKDHMNNSFNWLLNTCKSSSESFALVSHKVILRLISISVMNMNVEEGNNLFYDLDFKNSSITKLDWDGKDLYISDMNHTGHLS